MIAWLRWWLCRRELEELDRWHIACWEAERWFGEFPEVALALEHVRAVAQDQQPDFIDRVRKRMRDLRKADVERRAAILAPTIVKS